MKKHTTAADLPTTEQIAEMLGIDRKTLYNKLKLYHIE